MYWNWLIFLDYHDLIVTRTTHTLPIICTNEKDEERGQNIKPGKIDGYHLDPQNKQDNLLVHYTFTWTCQRMLTSMPNRRYQRNKKRQVNVKFQCTEKWNHIYHHYSYSLKTSIIFWEYVKTMLLQKISQISSFFEFLYQSCSQ